jgi:hypothetical protein
MPGLANVNGKLELGGGAEFWAYVSPQEETSKYVTDWKVSIEQTNGNWADSINSNDPQQELHTPNLSGIFNVKVTASGPNFKEMTLKPLPDSKPDVGCNSNCAAMVGIVADKGGKGAHYWTVWDAVCRPA